MNTNAKQQIGARLRSARAASGLSQKDMAEALLVSRQVISKWERGDSAPTVTQLAELAAMYCVCAHTLIFGVPYRDFAMGRLMSGWLKLAETQEDEHDGRETTD